MSLRPRCLIQGRISIFCLCTLLFQTSAPALHAQSPVVETPIDLTEYSRAFRVMNLVRQTPARFRIVVVEGDGAIDNLSQRTAREPIVRITDENDNPIAGVAVTFLVPDTGASGVFSNGLTSITVQSDNAGLAVGQGFTPNATQGSLQIQVNANYVGQSVSTTITQTNVVAAGAGTGAGGAAVGAGAGGIGAATVAVVVGVIVGVATGVAVAVGGGEDASASPNNDVPIPPPVTTVSLGGTSIGPD